MRYVIYKDDKISKLSLGTVQFGMDYGIANSNGKPSQKSVDEIVDYVYKHGINCFDTAQAYGDSEKVLGHSLKDKQDCIIISKLKSELFEKNLEQNITKSLKNLKQKTLFGLLLHDAKLLHRWEKQYSILVKKLVNEQKIKYFGVSIYTDKDFELAIGNDNIQIIQIPFNLFDQRAITKQWLKKAQETNKLIFIRSIFLQGLFFMDTEKLKGNMIQAKPYLEKLKKLEKKLNLSTSELAMSYVESVAKDSILLFGCDTLSQANENIKDYNKLPILDAEVLKEIENLFLEIPEDISNPTLWRLS